jgi:hypothetical protein
MTEQCLNWLKTIKVQKMWKLIFLGMEVIGVVSMAEIVVTTVD